MSEEDKAVKIPKAIKKMLLDDEQVLAVVKQSRLRALITPDSIIVTNHRIIRCSPSSLGLHKQIEDYRYEDIANLTIDKGIMFARIIVKRRFMSEDLVLDNLPGGRVDYIFRLIQENLRRIGGGGASPVTTDRQTPTGSPEDPLQVLKLRFARGEITREEFEEMKKVLE